MKTMEQINSCKKLTFTDFWCILVYCYSDGRTLVEGVGQMEPDEAAERPPSGL